MLEGIFVLWFLLVFLSLAYTVLQRAISANQLGAKTRLDAGCCIRRPLWIVLLHDRLPQSRRRHACHLYRSTLETSD